MEFGKNVYINKLNWIFCAITNEKELKYWQDMLSKMICAIQFLVVRGLHSKVTTKIRLSWTYKWVSPMLKKTPKPNQTKHTQNLAISDTHKINKWH